MLNTIKCIYYYYYYYYYYEIWHDIFTLFAEITEYLTHVCESSRYTNCVSLFINRVIVNSR
jgi:hypothetical protein